MFAKLLYNIGEYILNPVIVLAFVVALLVIFWGIFQFITSQTADAKRQEGLKKILYGVFGLFVMFAAKGLISFVLSTFGITPDPSAAQYIQ